MVRAVSGDTRPTHKAVDMAPASRSHWLAGFSSSWLLLCLLLLFLPQSPAAVVFANDVLGKLSHLRKSDRSEEKASLASSSPSSSSSPTTTEPGSATKRASSSPSSVKENSLVHGELVAEGHDRGKHDVFYEYFYEDVTEDAGTLVKSATTHNKNHSNDVAKDSNYADPYDNGTRALGDFDSVDRKSRQRPEEDNPSRLEHTSTMNSGDTKHEPSGRAEGSNHDGRRRCPHCALREEDRSLRVASLKRHILEKLHFTALPNRTGIRVPEALAHMTGIPSEFMQDSPYGTDHQQANADDDADDDNTTPERIFAVAKPIPSNLQISEQDACFFSIPPETYHSRVTKAYLWFYVRHASLPRSSVVEFKIYKIDSKRYMGAKNLVWSQKVIPAKAFGWKRVDILSLFRHWVKHPSSNYGIKILALSGDENLAILPPTSPIENGYEPIVDIKVTNDRKRRYKRSDALTCSENSTEHRCCRYPLYVSFAEFGWDWVIAPTHVKADYCSGECRMTLQEQTPYSWIAAQTPEGGGSCCTPSKMSALPLLYFDQNSNVVFQMLQNMKVERCGCA